MILCQLLFVVGGGLYTEGCRYVINERGIEVSEAVTVRHKQILLYINFLVLVDV